MTRHESPRIIEEGRTRELAERIAGWIVAEERRHSSWVMGVYGERGAGKTSLLLTLLEVLQRHEHADRLALPRAENDARSRAVIENLLKPAALRDHDELVFELLRHLEDIYSPDRDTTKRLFYRARAVEVQRRNVESFLQYEQEVGVSREELRRSNVKIHSKVASSTVRLKEVFGEIISMLRRDGQTLVLFVDDLDLHPERALQLLEIFHIFLGQKGVVIVLAADKPLLLDGIELGLRDNRRPAPGPDLAAAMLAKHIPYEWYIPIPTGSERLKDVWPDNEPGAGSSASQSVRGPTNPPSELSRWWPSEAKHKTLFGEDSRAHSNTRQFAKELLSQILPLTYRGLKALENRLDMVRQGFQCNDDGHVVIPSRDGWLGELRLDEILLPAFMSAVIIIDLQHPALALWSHIRIHPADVVQAMKAIDRAQRPRERPPSLTPDKDIKPYNPFDEPLLLFQRVRSLDKAESYMTEVRKQHLIHLSLIWAVLQQPRKDQSESNSGSATDSSKEFVHPAVGSAEQEQETRFLCLSLNADAMRMAEPEWNARYPREEVQSWHVDLHALVADPNHATRDELIRARNRAAALLIDRGIPSFPGTVKAFLKANYSFAVWLGWKLRYLQSIQVFNMRGSKFTPFGGPGRTLPFENTGRLELLEVTSRHGDGPAQEAVLLVDLLGHSRPEQLDAFRDLDGDPVTYRQGDHLLAHLGRGILPEQTEPFLRDCIETLGQLKRQGIEHVHLGLSMPDMLAFLLGQQLHARVARISLYEYRRTQGVYEYIFDLEEP